jgi:hypothetical protein
MVILGTEVKKYYFYKKYLFYKKVIMKKTYSSMIRAKLENLPANTPFADISPRKSGGLWLTVGTSSEEWSTEDLDNYSIIAITEEEFDKLTEAVSNYLLDPEINLD